MDFNHGKVSGAKGNIKFSSVCNENQYFSFPLN